MSIQFSQAVHNETDNNWIGLRLSKSIKSIVKEKGLAKGVLLTAAVANAKFYSLGLSFFCAQGAVKSIMEMVDDDRSIVKLRPLGDAGGWTALIIFSEMSSWNLVKRLIGEGEYLRLGEACQNWFQNNKNWIQKNLRFQKELYTKIVSLLDDFCIQCLSSKRLVTRRLQALEIYQKFGFEEIDEIYSVDQKLKNIFTQIHTELEQISTSKQYFRKLYLGQKSLKNTGNCSRFSSMIVGIAIPIILLTTSLLSIIGEFGLGKELFIDEEELTDIGHFGEWPFNAMEALCVAVYFHIWCLINEGDFIMTRNIYAHHLDSVKDDESLHSRLTEVANDELSKSASNCYYSKLSIDYKFEKL